MFSSANCLALVALGFSTFTAATNTDLKKIFGSSLSPDAQIYQATDPAFATNVTQRWTLHDAPTYFGAIKPATEQDVQNIVKIAVKKNIPFLATGGGYSDSITLGNLNSGLEIDLSLLTSVSLDAKRSLLTIGGGTRFSQVLAPLYAAGKQMAIGTADCVGIIGTTLGGGVSSYQGRHGLLIDTLKSVRLITAAGEAITVSSSQNSDLFWGIRGGGANFGIITSAVYEVFDADNDGLVMVADFEYYGYSNVSVFNALKTFDNHLPSKLGINIGTIFDPASQGLGMIVNINYFGNATEGLKLVQPFIDAGPVLSNVQSVPWTDVIKSSYFGLDGGACNYGQYANAYTVGAKQTNVTTLSKFLGTYLTYALENPTVRPSFVIHRWPQQAVLDVRDDETAYPYRDLKMHFQLETYYAPNQPALDATVDTFSKGARSLLQSTSGYPTLATYVNFAHGDEGPIAWHGANKLDRLISLKKKWDPKQVFGFYNAIPTK